MGSTTSADVDRLRAYAPGDEAAIQELFSAVFGRDRSDEAWAWRFRRAPAGPALIHLVERRDEVIGHISHVGFPTYARGEGPIHVAQGGDTMVDPRFQGEGLMRALIDGFLSSSHGYDARMNFPTDKAARLMERYGGGRYLGRIPQWVRAAAPSVAWARADVLLKPAAWLGTAIGRAASSVRSALTVRTSDRVSGEYDQLARASAGFAPFIRVRDAGYVRWRWLEQPDRSWTLIETRDADQLRGWAVVGMDPTETGLGRIVDLLCSDARATRALLLAAAARLETQGADRVTLDLVDPRPWVRRACASAGFMRFGTGVNVIARALSPAADPSIEDLSAWYLTRGDTDLA